MPSCILMCLNKLPPWTSFKSFKHPHGVLPTSIEQAIEEYSADALRLALADACKRYVVDPGLLYGIADSAIRTINGDIWWISRHVVGVQESDSCLRRAFLFSNESGEHDAAELPGLHVWTSPPFKHLSTSRCRGLVQEIMICCGVSWMYRRVIVLQ